MGVLRAMAVAGMVVNSATAGDPSTAPARAVLVCMNPGANASPVYRAEMTASQVIANAGVKLRWEADPRSCAAPKQAIVITLVENTPVDHHPGAMAYAMPYERTTIVVFHDRIQAVGVPALLAHVLVHEIVHILQGVASHSTTGMMKAKWNAADYSEMHRKLLDLSADDVVLIHNGLATRDRAYVRLGETESPRSAMNSDHSYRSAWIGSIALARRAGSHPEIAATTAKMASDAAALTMSVGFTPNSWVDT